MMADFCVCSATSQRGTNSLELVSLRWEWISEGRRSGEEQRGSFHADQNVSIPLHVGGSVPSRLQVKVFSIVGTQGQGVALFR